VADPIFCYRKLLLASRILLWQQFYLDQVGVMASLSRHNHHTYPKDGKGVITLKNLTLQNGHYACQEKK
jgi:hypothetical protein